MPDNPIREDDGHFTVDSTKPYPYAEAIVVARMNRDRVSTPAVIGQGRLVARQFVQEFRPEELPLVIRTTLYAVACAGTLETLTVMDRGMKIAVAHHLNVMTCAALELHDHLADLDPEFRL